MGKMYRRVADWRTVLVAGLWMVAGSVSAISFPEVVDGTITLDVAAGVTNTYNAVLPNVASVVKTGAGCAVLAAASSSFTGQVDVRDGTLRLTHIDAVGSSRADGTTGKLAVTGDAATLHLNFPAPSGAHQGTTFFAGHDITIRGKGVDGKGTLRWTDPNKTDSMYDSMIDTLTLSGDAYLSVTHRYGFAKALNLNGHVLTRIDGGSQWMWYNEACVIGAGVVSNVTGTITFQNTQKFADPANTTLYMAGGTLHLWSAFPIPCRVVMCGGKVSAGSWWKTTPRRNVFTGPFEVVKNTAIDVGATNRVVELLGPTTVSANLTVTGSGTLYLDGPFEMSAGDFYGNWESRVVCSSNVVRALRGLVLAGGRTTRFNVYGGVVTNTMLRVANGGGWRSVLVQTNGALVNAGNSYVGESTGSYGAYLMSGGESIMNYELNICAATNSEGVVWQTGGRMRLDHEFIRIGCSGRGFLGVFNGATNDTWVSKYGGQTRLHLGNQATGRGTLVVSGTGSVVQTESVVMGSAGVVSTNLIVVTDGGTLKARRFYRAENTDAESVNEVYVDGGIIMPTFHAGWGHVSPGDARFFRRSPDHWTIGPRGMAVDTSDLLGENAEHVAETVDFPYALTDTAGRGIASIELPTDAAFTAEVYCGPAFVDIEGQDGSYGAAAMAAFDPDTCKLTHVVVMSPGCRYDETTRVYVRAAKATGRYECAYTLTDVRSGGVLIKRGSGTFKAYGTNDYTGGTVVEGGTLQMINATSFPSNTPLTVKTGGTFNNNGRALVVSTLGGVGGTVTSCGRDVTVNAGLEISAAELYAAPGPLTVRSAVAFADGATVRVTDPENLPPHRHGASVAFLTATGGFTGTIPRLNLVDETGTSWTVFRRGDELRLTPVNGTLLILR